eukprot:TRINITY_DN37375_c0_g1_i1.p1 TRINITY_DN37375_c0_g1~~TRINITY_DN37375_c0_g1_i1.p1  ORF type:complete len:358 (+),score=90.66 TRINITY_DN37375_c0_g1_i1:92-1165(+)
MNIADHRTMVDNINAMPPAKLSAVVGSRMVVRTAATVSEEYLMAADFGGELFPARLFCAACSRLASAALSWYSEPSCSVSYLMRWLVFRRATPPIVPNRPGVFPASLDTAVQIAALYLAADVLHMEMLRQCGYPLLLLLSKAASIGAHRILMGPGRMMHSVGVLPAAGAALYMSSDPPEMLKPWWWCLLGSGALGLMEGLRTKVYWDRTGYPRTPPGMGTRWRFYNDCVAALSAAVVIIWYRSDVEAVQFMRAHPQAAWAFAVCVLSRAVCALQNTNSVHYARAAVPGAMMHAVSLAQPLWGVYLSYRMLGRQWTPRRVAAFASLVVGHCYSGRRQWRVLLAAAAAAVSRCLRRLWG